MTLNLIKTINDDDEVEDFSEESDQEINVSFAIFRIEHKKKSISKFQFQPTKQKSKKKADFDTDFQFVSTTAEYNKDPWDDLKKYIKRKAKTKTDDKIKELRKKKNLTNEVIEDEPKQENGNESEVSLSDDELKHDNIKIKGKLKKKKVAEEEEQFFDETEVAPYDEAATFYQMNLSRPLLKAINDLKYVHPTPVQAATIPVALLGKTWEINQKIYIFHSNQKI